MGMEDDSASRGGYNWGGIPGLLSLEQATREELKRRAEYEQRPDVVEAKRQAALSRERMERLTVGKDGKPRLIGPPNPYKPHRKLGPEDHC